MGERISSPIGEENGIRGIRGAVRLMRRGVALLG